jgi:hypothetical protein
MATLGDILPSSVSAYFTTSLYQYEVPEGLATLAVLPCAMAGLSLPLSPHPSGETNIAQITETHLTPQILSCHITRLEVEPLDAMVAVPYSRQFSKVRLLTSLLRLSNAQLQRSRPV